MDSDYICGYGSDDGIDTHWGNQSEVDEIGAGSSRSTSGYKRVWIDWKKEDLRFTPEQLYMLSVCQGDPKSDRFISGVYSGGFCSKKQEEVLMKIYCSRFCSYVETLEVQIIKLRRKVKTWTSVKDALPDENIEVLVCNMNGSCLDERDPVIAYWEDGWHSIAWWDFDQSATPLVTHWMQLPTLPAIKE